MAVVTGLFRDRESAERAYQVVVERGYDTADINLLMSDETRNRYFGGRASTASTALGNKGAEGVEKKAATKLGGPLGGTLGTIGTALAALGTVFVPLGLGFVIAGPLAAALAAAGSVALVGGLIGALTHWGIPKERLEHYESGIRGGGILIGVMPHSDEDAVYFEQQWTASGGEQVHSKA